MKYRTAEQISAVMRRVKSRDTAAELSLRRALWAKGLRYRVCVRDLPGRPDIVFPGPRLAVFVDGDYWHGHQWARRGCSSLADQFRESPSRQYWVTKIGGNVERDRLQTQELIGKGWSVLRFWESDIRDNLEACVNAIVAAVHHSSGRTPHDSIPAKTVAEFFAGIGLMRLGLERQGWNTVFANDIDPRKHQMYSRHFADAADLFVLENVNTLASAAVPTVTLATASFPCNDLSVAGGRHGLAGKESSAFWGFSRILGEMGSRRPPLVLLENVTGFLSSHGGRDFRDALVSLAELGYDLDAFIIDAARFVPQSRQRLFVVGTARANELVKERRANLGFFQSDLRPRPLAEFILLNSDLPWRIRELPSLPERTLNLADILDADSVENGWWSEERTQYLLNQMSPKHRQEAEQMISGSDLSVGTVFRRVRSTGSMAELRTDGTAGCLRTPRGGSGRQILFCGCNGKARARLLTPRECARLMGADDYSIDVPSNQALFGFGDAVCVPAISWIASNYLNPLVTELMRGRPMGLQISTANRPRECYVAQR